MARLARVGCLLGGLALLPAAPGLSQSARSIEPGRIATAAVSLEDLRRPGIDLTEYTVELLPGVRLVGSDRGTIDWGAGEAVLPLTLSVARDHAAGPATVARVVLHWEGGQRDTRELRLTVLRHSRITASLEPDQASVEPGRTAQLRYTIANEGNAADTVHLQVVAPPGWRVAVPTRSLLVGAGERVIASARVVAPREARPGTSPTLRLVATGPANTAEAVTQLPVTAAAGPVPGLVHLPATLFVGTAGRPGAAGSPSQWQGARLDASGTIAPATHLSLRYRYSPERLAGRVFGGGFAVGAPGFSATLRRAAWTAAFGDLAAGGQGVGALGVVRARGFSLARRSVGREAEIVAARPLSSFGLREPGHLLRAAGRIRTGAGTFGLAATDVERSTGAAHVFGAPTQGHRRQTAAVSYESNHSGPHRVRAESGVMHLSAATGETRSGPAFDFNYGFSTPPLSLNAQLRHIPATLPSLGGGTGSRAAGGGRVALSEGLSASAQAFAQTRPILDSGSELRTEGASGRLRGTVAGAWLEGGATYSETRGPWHFLRRTVTAAGGLPLGPLSLDASAEVGETESAGLAMPLERYRAQVRWSGHAGQVWVGGRHGREHLGGERTRAEFGARLRGDRWQFDAGTGGALQEEWPLGFIGHRWANASLDLSSRLTLVLGAENRSLGSGRTPVMVGIGIQRRLSVPLPISPAPAVSGVVFEDLNDNGVRDPGEPGIEGVRVTLGAARTSTAGGGRFAFPAAAGAAQVEVDVTTLPPGWMVRGGAPARADRGLEIPVVRTTSLRLILFLDPVGSGVRGPESQMAVGARITLTDSRGRRRSATADDGGVVNVVGLIPGRYTVTVDGVPGLDPAIRPVSAEVLLEPERGSMQELAVPWRPRDIRMRVFGEQTDG